MNINPMKRNFGLWLIIFLAAVPIFIWYGMEKISLRFISFDQALASIGQVSGLTGTVLFALALILGARAKFLDKIFSGINNAYIYHHDLGAIAFSLLLLHPVALALRYVLISTQAAFNFLISGDWVIIAGEAGLLIMMFLLILTFFSKLRYQTWKITHKYLGLAFFVSSFHVYFVSSDISQNVLMRTYILSAIIMGMAAILYRSVFPEFLVRKYKYVVEKVENISENLVEVSMVNTGKKMDYEPGQFIFIRFKDRVVGDEIHPFSITSSPGDDKVKIAVKALGDFTSRLKLLKPDTEASVEGPYGKFSYLNFPPERKQIWIAGGIGIAPFLSMARNLNKSVKYDIDLYYCSNTREELAFWDELKEISDKGNGFKILPFCSNESGYISAEFILKTSDWNTNAEIFICGPGAMMNSLKKQFLKLGVKNNSIHMEEFKMY